MCEADSRVIFLGGRRGQKNYFALRVKPGLCEPHQFSSDPLFLAGDVHSQIRKITAVAEIGYRPRHPDQ